MIVNDRKILANLKLAPVIFWIILLSSCFFYVIWSYFYSDDIDQSIFANIFGKYTFLLFLSILICGITYLFLIARNRIGYVSVEGKSLIYSGKNFGMISDIDRIYIKRKIMLIKFVVIVLRNKKNISINSLFIDKSPDDLIRGIEELR